MRRVGEELAEEQRRRIVTVELACRGEHLVIDRPSYALESIAVILIIGTCGMQTKWGPHRRQLRHTECTEAGGRSTVPHTGLQCEL